MEIKINNEFKKLIPPLSPDEFSILEKNILADGCRDPLVLWQGFIVDGHNRYEICQKHSIQFKTETKEFENDSSVKVWMIDNQKGRRNLTDGWKWELAQTKKALLMEKGRENKGANQYTPERVLSTIDKTQHNTRNEIADDLGWSTGKVAMADVVWKRAAPEVKEKIKQGETTINQAYTEIKRGIKKENYEKKKAQFDLPINTTTVKREILHGNCVEVLNSMPLIGADLLLTDPPYAMDYKSGWNDWDKIEGDKRHETIELLEKAFEAAKPHLKEDAHVYVFGSPNEIENIKPIFCKYFNLKNILIWDRGIIGMGDLKTYGRSYDVIYFGYNEIWKDLNGVRERDVLSFNRVNPSDLKHPTEKPTAILEYLKNLESCNGFGQLDVIAKIKTNWYLFEVKHQEAFKAPPFDGHGLPPWQINFRMRIFKELGIIPILFVVDKQTKIIYYNSIIKLEEGEKFVTKTGKRIIYPIENFKILKVLK
ncbi:MAG: hypothetical protein EOM23_04675 [Candidatus Moranbacteria bacterium]|nr:hypothetical protein [Candidatus Moranbacteria bacterium]